MNRHAFAVLVATAVLCAVPTLPARADPVTVFGQNVNDLRFTNTLRDAFLSPTLLTSHAYNAKSTSLVVTELPTGEAARRLYTYEGGRFADHLRQDNGLAQAVADLQPSPPRGGTVAPHELPPQAQAQSSHFASRVLTNTMRTYGAFNTVDARGLNCGPPGGFEDCGLETVDVSLSQSHRTRASAGWADVWSVDQTSVVQLQFRVHARLALDLHGLGSSLNTAELSALNQHHQADNFITAGLNDWNVLAGGGGTVVTEQQNFEFLSQLMVMDLSALAECGSPQQPCGPEGLPPVVAGRGAWAVGRTLSTDENGHGVTHRSELYQLLDELGSYEVDLTLNFSFLAEAGRAYLVLGATDVSSEGGIDIDGFNTFALQGLQVAPGTTLTSFAVENFGARLPGPGTTGSVPLPGTLALLALACVLLLRASRVRSGT